MNAPIRIRPLAPRDAMIVTSMIQQSFDPRLHPFIAYCQERAAEHLTMMSANSALMPSTHLIVAEVKERVVGFADFRFGIHEDFLSNVCVSTGSRGQGIATKLLRWWMDMADRETLSLDVFADNHPAIRLYERFGFQFLHEHYWTVRPLTLGVNDESVDVQVKDFPNTFASLRTFGFAQLTVSYKETDYRLGLPSTQVLRVPDEPLFGDDSFLTSIKYLMPALTTALFTQAADIPPSDASCEMVQRSQRMQLTKTTARERSK